MIKRIIVSQEAPEALGPYSQAVQVGPFVFTSGQIPIDPETGEVMEGDISLQTRRVFENLRAVLATAGLTFAHVIKTTLFVKDMSQFPKINQVYGEYFPADPPARSTVEVSRLPKDVALEIDMTAYLGDEEGKPV